MGSGHGYRTKIEVLRDFLQAARVPVPKTRIIGTANLNPTSFQRYLRLCTERDLITSTAGGYVATPRAVPILAAIDGVLSKSSELEGAVRALERSTQDRPDPNGRDGAMLRHIARHAWSEIVLAAPPAGRVEPNGGGPTTLAALRTGAYGRPGPGSAAPRPRSVGRRKLDMGGPGNRRDRRSSRNGIPRRRAGA